MMKKLSAHLLALADPLMERIYGSRKRRLFKGHPELIVEIGPGSGINFRYYRPGTRVIAFEPNRAQHERLRRRVAVAGLDLDLRRGKAETLDLDDASVPMVVSTLVLCSVDDHVRVIDEIHRVLQPGGRFVFIEHVAAPVDSKLRRWQSGLRVPWRFLCDGCTLDRDSAEVVMSAGFQEREIERFRLSPKWLPFSPHVVGVFEKPS
ncbi:MAG: class I SAM-dependent methyltransferase [Acidobacteria bacterium]|nr:class I SAM-dependent methyltransferase [Acidobacteriota bacterium]